MTPREKLKQLLKLTEKRTGFIDKQLLALEKLLDELAPELSEKVAKEFLSQLDIEDGIIKPTISNQNKVAMLNKIYQEFIDESGHKIVRSMVTDLLKVGVMNSEYFASLTRLKIDSKAVEGIIMNRLGINPDGSLRRQGFMRAVLDSQEVRQEIVDFTLEKVTNGTGYEDLRKGLKGLIQGDQKMGKFKSFYRNVAYDIYPKVDATNGKLYGDKLELKYFIYAGTRRKASRHFCIERKGKVFTREEAEKWKDLIGTQAVNDKGKVVPAGPILVAEDVPTYNPFIDRGGYGCVDDIMWIGDDVAYSMRPDLKPTV